MDLSGIKEQYIDPKIQGWPSYEKRLADLPPLEGLVGLDLEYDPSTQRPYMISLAMRGCCASVPIEKGIWAAKTLPNREDVTLIGHNILSADLKVLHDTFDTPLLPDSHPIDTLLAFYLMNQHLCQGKDEGEEGMIDIRRGPGKLNLGSMASLYLNWAEYKTCRGSLCDGPCPDHAEAWYNALDSLAPIECWDAMVKQAKEFPSEYHPSGVPLRKLHDHLLLTQSALNKISEIGILTDREKAARIAAEVESGRQDIFPREQRPRYHKRTGKQLSTTETVYTCGFNPDSHKQVKDFFNHRGIKLKKSDADSVKAALDKHRGDPNLSYAVGLLEKLLQYKSIGTGISNWFDPKYIHDDDRLHPRWSAFGGAMGRPVSADPNCQNMPKRGTLARARSVWIAPPGYRILKSDARQGEPRVMLFIGGLDPADAPENVYKFIIEQTGDLFERVAREAPEYSKIIPEKGLAKAAYAAAKRTVMAYLYFEGGKLVSEKQLSNPRSPIARAHAQGALWVNRDWIVDDKFVCFDGSHLAESFFRDSSYNHRHEALMVQKRLAESVPMLQTAQKKIIKMAEAGYIVTPSGRLFQLLNDTRDNIKKALAFCGQSVLSDYMQESLIMYDQLGHLPAIYIHDEFGFYVPRSWSKKKCLDFLEPMRHESKLIGGGFWCPTDAEWGDNYFELEDLSA